MRAPLFVLCGLLLVSPVLAAEKEAAHGEGAKKASGEAEGVPGTNLDLPILIAPVTVDGKLTGYAYVQSRLTGATPADVIAVREKIAFVLDAFVRDVNARPVTLPDDPAQVDKTGLAARMLADARGIMGAGRVKAVTVTEVQVAPLHPVQTAAPNVAPPPEPAPAAPAKPAEKH